MKNIMLVLILILCLALTACDAASIGIIGGADGPTAIYVGDGLAEGVEAVRMFKADGYLWYDTGRVSDNTPRCGTLDGNLHAEAATYEIPKNNGESNFGKDINHFGYQSCTSITKEVPLDEGWVIFKKIEGENLDRYKYCFHIKGRLPNADKDWEFVVLTNDITIDFDKVTKPLFSSDMEEIKNAVDCHIVFIPSDDKWGIRLSAENVTSNGVKLLCEQFGGNPIGELQTGADYILEINNDGQWQSVPPVQSKYAWNSLAYSIAKNEITEWEINWEWLYGKLPAGYYRIGKKISDFRDTGDYDTAIYYAEFAVE